jgi:hypothetical protein
MEASDEGCVEKIEAIQIRHAVFPAMSFARVPTWIWHPLAADAIGLARSSYLKSQRSAQSCIRDLPESPSA